MSATQKSPLEELRERHAAALEAGDLDLAAELASRIMEAEDKVPAQASLSKPGRADSEKK